MTGLDCLLESTSLHRLENKRIGLIANPTTVNTSLSHAVDELHRRIGLTRLFGPEHGIRGDAQDMISVDAASDPLTGCEVVSLYGDSFDSLSPKVSQIQDLDVLIFDIQDIGARYYTYVWTMVLAMRVCEKAGVEMMVLDRPNPLGGNVIEGSKRHDGFDSFVGLCDVPNQHGLTVGEVAAWRHKEEKMSFPLSVIKMKGWKRDLLFEDTGLPWVMPSPNMPTLDTVLVYPGMCLVEGTEMSEARGTTKPFELFGAPYIDGNTLVKELSTMSLPGVTFRPCSFLPQFQKHAKTLCGGLQIHVTDRKAFQSYRTAISILFAVKKCWPSDFQFREKAYEFVDDVPAIDLLFGSPLLREAIDGGGSRQDVFSVLRQDEKEYKESMKDLHLYS